MTSPTDSKALDFYDLLEKLDEAFHKTGAYGSADDIAKSANEVIRRDMAPSWHVRELCEDDEFQVAVLFDGLNPSGGDDVEFGSRFRIDASLSDMIVEDVFLHSSDGKSGSAENSAHFERLKSAVGISLDLAAKKLGLAP